MKLKERCYIRLLYVFDVLDFHDGVLIVFAWHRNVGLSLLSQCFVSLGHYLTGNGFFS